MRNILVVDGNSIINRAFYGIRLLTAKDGTYTNAVYGFMNMFFKMLSSERPTYVAVAFDLKAPTFRHKMYPEYKATRQKTPEDLHAQVPIIEEILTAFGVTTIRQDGFEADDLIATIAHQCKKQNRECHPHKILLFRGWLFCNQ